MPEPGAASRLWASRAVLAGFLLAAAPARGEGVERWRTYIDEAAARFGVPVAWIKRVMRAESGGRTRLSDRPITSRAGAMGLMQVMPGTWAEMRRTYGLGPDPHDPRDNILAGTAYLRLMHERFGYPGLFAAYNAGPTRYAVHLATGRSLPTETRSYVLRVAGRVPRAADVLAPTRSLFFVLTAGRIASTPALRPEPSPGLFLVSHPDTLLRVELDSGG